MKKSNPSRTSPIQNGIGSHLQLYEVLAYKRNDIKDVGEQFMDAMLKGLAAWKSAAARGLLCWGFVVLHKTVSKRDGVLWALLYWKTGLHEGQDFVRPWARCHNLSNPCMGSACDALTCGFTLS